jgi:hypothetical protein
MASEIGPSPLFAELIFGPGPKSLPRLFFPLYQGEIAGDFEDRLCLSIPIDYINSLKLNKARLSGAVLLELAGMGQHQGHGV